MQTTLARLIEQATTSFFSAIEKRKEELLTIEEETALSKVCDELGLILDSVLDDKQDNFTQLLLACCVERPDLFTTQPEAMNCILESEENGFPGRVTAQHCVFHNLYDLIKAELELAFLLWHQEQRRSLYNEYLDLLDNK